MILLILLILNFKEPSTTIITISICVVVVVVLIAAGIIGVAFYFRISSSKKAKIMCEGTIQVKIQPETYEKFYSKGI